MNRTTKEELIEALTKRFPKAWFKDGAEFGSGTDTAVWTGEGSALNNDMSMFNYYSERECYLHGFGAHKELCDFVENYGYYVECYDAGTFFIYPQ